MAGWEAKEKLLSYLSYAPVTVDELLRHAQLAPHVFFEALIELELLGHVYRSFGDKVTLR